MESLARRWSLHRSPIYASASCHRHHACTLLVVASGTRSIAWIAEKDSSPAAFRICCCAANRKYQASFDPIHPQYCKLFHTVTHNRLPRLEIISESQQERPPSRCSPINALNDARSDQHTIARAAASVPCTVRPVQTNTWMRVQFDSLHDFNDPERSHQSCCV
jgi:hypothetical protein